MIIPFKPCKFCIPISVVLMVAGFYMLFGIYVAGDPPAGKETVMGVVKYLGITLSVLGFFGFIRALIYINRPENEQ